jgi:hypothetical protein
MARVKTAYKPKAYRDGGAVHSDITIDIQVPQENLESSPKPEAQPAADDASMAFQKQIAALEESERIHRARAEHARHAAKVDQILKENPEMLSNPGLVAEAEQEAYQAGHLPYSDIFHEAVKNSFQSKLTAKNSPPPSPPMAYEVKSYDLPEPRNNTAFVSAPVSRETQANGSYNSYGERPGRVTLSRAQKEAARLSGISEAEYAAQVLRLREEKEAGNYGGGP